MRNENVARIGNPYDYLDRNRPRKMVFYGRVSTEHEAQLDALKNQTGLYSGDLTLLEGQIQEKLQNMYGLNNHSEINTLKKEINSLILSI